MYNKIKLTFIIMFSIALIACDNLELHKNININNIDSYSNKQLESFDVLNKLKSLQNKDELASFNRNLVLIVKSLKLEKNKVIIEYELKNTSKKDIKEVDWLLYLINESNVIISKKVNLDLLKYHKSNLSNNKLIGVRLSINLSDVNEVFHDSINDISNIQIVTIERSIKFNDDTNINVFSK